MRYRSLGLLSLLLLLSLLVLLVSPSGETVTELVEGQHPLYIVKEVVEVTSDWTEVKWIQGPKVIVVRHKVLEGADAPEFRIRVSGLGVHVVKRQYDTTKVVIEVEALTLKGDITAKVNIESGALGYTKVQLNAYDITTSNFVNVGEFIDGTQGPKDFELELSTLYDIPSATANVEKAVKQLEKKVFAFYYPWYGSPAGPSGLWEHWEGVTNEYISSSAHYPLLGAYDSADERVILAHMAMAKHAGIDGFISSWWGIGTFEDNQVRRILSVAEQVGLKISMYYESVRNLTQQGIIEELSYIVNSYADSPSFLKDSGRPVLFIYAISYDYWVRDANFWLKVRRGVEANVGPVVLIGDTVDQGYLHVFDGFHTYIYLGEDVEAFYVDAVERLESGLSSSEEVSKAFSSAYSGGKVSVDLKSFSLTVIPGNDLTAIGGDPDLFRDRGGGEFYARHWDVALELDVHSVLITSWNEWHEGTEIEPSREYGFDYIGLTRQFVEKYKQTALSTPEVSFSATVHTFELYPDLRGNGSIVLATAAEAPALLIRIEIRGLEGASELDLQGDFYTYLEEQNGTYVSVVISSVPSLSNLVVRVAFTAGMIKPLLEVHITAYEPSGRLHELFKGQLRISGKTTTTTTTAFTTTTTTTTATTTVERAVPTIEPTSVAAAGVVALIVGLAVGWLGGTRRKS